MFDTLRACDASASLTVLLYDGEPGADDVPGASVIGVADLLGERAGMTAAGNPPGALTAALAPHLLRALMDVDGQPAVYIGAGLRICRPLSELEDLLSAHEIVLVARSRDAGGEKPVLAQADEGAFSRHLIAMRPGDSASALLGAWPSYFAGAGDDGAGAVRAWMDSIPAVADRVGVVRGPGYLDAEGLAGSEVSEAGGELRVSGAAPVVVDFSELQPSSPLSWLRDSDRDRLSSMPALVRLLEAHAADLLAAGLTESPDAAAVELEDGFRFTDTSRSLLLQAVLDGVLASSPFTTAGREALYRYLMEPDDRGRVAGLSRLHMAIWDSRTDLREAYSHLEGPDGSGFAGWLCVHGPEQEGLVPELFPPAPEEAYRDSDPHISLQASTFGVNVVGFFTSELGVGEVARLLMSGLDAAGVPALPVRGQLAPPARQGIEYPHVTLDQAVYPVNILCINGDGIPVFAREAGRSFFEHRHTIAVWWWEVGDPPPTWTPAYEFIDEVWAGSRYVAEAIAPTSPVPVVRFTLPVEEPEVSPRSRAELGLPEDGFIFLNVHDYHSVAARKNPLGLIEAFRRAFPPGSGAVLVVKSINADANLAQHERTLAAAAGHPDIHLLDGYVSPQEKNSIIAACDCFVSLHRSEGFGLTMAEAMLLAKPVIATRYGGSLEFMDDENSFLVDCRPAPVGDGAYPYAPEAVWGIPTWSTPPR